MQRVGLQAVARIHGIPHLQGKCINHHQWAESQKVPAWEKTPPKPSWGWQAAEGKQPLLALFPRPCQPICSLPNQHAVTSATWPSPPWYPRCAPLSQKDRQSRHDGGHTWPGQLQGTLAKLATVRREEGRGGKGRRRRKGEGSRGEERGEVRQGKKGKEEKGGKRRKKWEKGKRRIRK